MRFLVDAQLPPALAVWLRARGHEAEHVRDIGLEARPDRWITTQAIKTGAIIVTKDSDFSKAWVNKSGCQVLWLRHGNSRSANLIRSLEPTFSEIEQALTSGQKLVEVLGE